MQGRRHGVDTLFVLLLFGIYAVLTLCVCTVGARVYAKSADDLEQSYTLRTAALYVTQKVRFCADAQAVAVESDGHVLALKEEVEGEPYVTRIYVYEGNLCEAYSAVEVPFEPGAGQKLMRLHDFSVSLDADGLLCAVLCDEKGSTEKTFVCLRAGGDAS